MMKTVAFLLAFLAAASAFAPAGVSPRTSVAVNALFDDVSRDEDLFSVPVDSALVKIVA
jgi:hypothetical protein